MMPDLGSQLHCTLYTFIVLGKIMYSNIFYGIVSIVLWFFCVLVFYCFNKRISVSPKPGMVYPSHCQYIGETKRQLSEHFGEHHRSILNHHQLSNPSPVSLHFNQPGHSINDIHLIQLELIRSKRDSVRKAREAHLINKAKTLQPFGINRRDEARQ